MEKVWERRSHAFPPHSTPGFASNWFYILLQVRDIGKSVNRLITFVRHFYAIIQYRRSDFLLKKADGEQTL